MYLHQHNTMVYQSQRMVTTIFIISICLLDFCVAEIRPPNYTFMHDATKAPKVSFYDYIIIGGGAAGIPLATTLSATSSVLLLERGGSPYGDSNITNMVNFGSYFLDTSPGSPSQQFTSNGVVNARARVLGGGTSINLGFYSRADPRFVKEAALMDGSLVQRSYEWVEKVMVFEPVVTKWESAVRAGIVEAGVGPDNGFKYDHFIGTKVGGTIFDENGLRHTAADLLQYANPKGLTVFIHATVHKVLFRTKARSRPKAHGVVFEDSRGNKHRAYLKGGQKDEIILCAGALGSPQLLMLSGIGPRDQLEAHKIKVVKHNPFVGKGMADNPLNGVFVPSPTAIEPSVIQVVGVTRFGSYIQAVGGFNFLSRSPSNKMRGLVYEKVEGPLSTGDLKIKNRNPSENPIVTFNYFKERKDLTKCVKGIRTVLSVVESKAFSKFKYANMTVKDLLDLNMKLTENLHVNANASSSLQQYCKETVRTVWHYHGGCHIGKVVDKEYKVFGVDALRVIDGSTLLNSPGTNPQASLLMLGRYMGVTILARRSTRSEEVE